MDRVSNRPDDAIPREGPPVVFHPSDERSASLHCTHCGRWLDPQLALCPPCRSRYDDDRLRRNQGIILFVAALALVLSAVSAWFSWRSMKSSEWSASVIAAQGGMHK